MPAKLRTSVMILAFALALPFAGFAQQNASGEKPAAENATKSAASEKFDPHDLNGVWNMDFPPHATEKVLEAYVSQFGNGEPPMTPWAQERFDKTKPSFGPRGVLVGQTNDPAFQCFPPGVPRIYLHPFPLEIVQTPKETIMLFEYDHIVRHIYTDGRQHPADVTPTYMGDSIGHWEGDTFVIDTVGFNDKTWLDRVGHPHSDKLHVTERLKRTDATHMEIAFTIEDPVAYTHSFGSSLFFRLHPTWNIMEQVCEDNAAFLPFEETGKMPDSK